MRILTNFFLLIFSTLSSVTFAQADKSAMAKIPLLTAWQKGDVQTYELIKGALFHSSPQDSLQQQTRQLVTISVKEVGTRGFVMTAQYHSPALLLTDDVKKLANGAALVEKYRHFGVEYAISSTGEFLKLGNVGAIRQMLADFFDAIYSNNAQTELSDAVLLNLEKMMTSEAYLTEGLFQELRLFHQFHGNEYAPDSRQEYSTELANMLDPAGAPIPAKATLQVGLPAANLCLIEHTLQPDSATMHQLTLDFVKRMTDGAVTLENDGSVAFDVRDKGRFVYHIKSGWLVELEKHRITAMDGQKRDDFIKMRLLNQDGGF